jgi:hypothetical protein
MRRVRRKKPVWLNDKGNLERKKLLMVGLVAGALALQVVSGSAQGLP